MWATLRHPIVWWVAIPYFVILFSQLAVNFYLPTIIKDTLHVSNSRVGLLTGLISVVGTIGMLVNGSWSDRSGAHHAQRGAARHRDGGAILAATAANPALVVFGLALSSSATTA